MFAEGPARVDIGFLVPWGSKSMQTTHSEPESLKVLPSLDCSECWGNKLMYYVMFFLNRYPMACRKKRRRQAWRSALAGKSRVLRLRADGGTDFHKHPELSQRLEV